MTSERRVPSAGRWARIPRGRCAAAAASVLAIAWLGGCATAADDAPQEYLDSKTAATITVGAPVLVFARERPELAVNARDYLTLVPVDVNQAGKHAQYYYGYLWSTIDKRRLEETAEAAPRLALIADGRAIALEPPAGSLRDLGIGDAPLPPPSRTAKVVVAGTTRDTQSFVAGADDLRVVASGDGGPERFELWSR